MATGLMEIMDLIYGFQKFQVLYTCTSLGVFEELNHNTVGPMTAESLAARLALHPSSLGRLMNAAATLKLLNRHSTGPQQPAKYSNSGTVEKFLVKSCPGSMRALVQKMGDMYTMWGKLSEAVQDGSCLIPMALSFSPSGSPESCPETEKESPLIKANQGLYSSQTKQLEFMRVMHMFSCSDAKQVVQAFDLSEYSSVCDLGGGTGAIGAHIAESNPHMHVTVQDLPEVIASAAHFNPNKPHNLSFQAGDFFKSPLPAADLFILSHVIHDWDAKDVDALLKKVHNALPKGGAVLILEKCLNENKTSPFQTVFFDLGMLVMSEGQERTAPEYRTLLKRHNFTNIIVKILPKAMYRDAILARKE